jgi:hypothetical protein
MRLRLALAVALILTAIAAPLARAGTADPLSAASLYADVGDYARIAPDHLTGSPEEAATQRWVADNLARAGLQTGANSYTFLRFAPKTVALTVAGHKVRSPATRFYSGTTPPAGVSRPLVYAGLGSAEEDSKAGVAGNLEVIDVPMADDVASPTLDQAFTAAKAAGAAGLIAVTEGPQDYPVQEDIDSRQGMQGMPTVFVGKASGAGVIAAAKASERATLTVVATVGTGCDADVYGVLPGADPSHYVIVGTPTSGFDRAASERGAGVAVLLGLARHYASLALAERPLTMVFVATSGHEIGFLGLPLFMQAHPQWFTNAQSYVHLGASIAAAQLVEAPDGSVERLPSGDATRLFYVSENPLLGPAVQASFAATGTATGSSFPAARNVGEQAYPYHAGVPIVSISGSSYFFHTPGDQPDGVDQSLLASMAAGFRGSIDYVDSLPPGAAPAANGAAVAAGAQQNPNPTPSGSSGTGNPAYQPTPVSSCP